jgi:flagellar assembly protein FliH
MSSRGRRLTSVPVDTFSWLLARPVPSGRASGPPSVGPVPRVPDERETAEASESDPGVGGVTLAEQQARLAALEREAFTKGYAQGERAGLEAGAKRAEAMLRRVAQTLEELSTLRDAVVRQSEQELVQLAVAIARRILQREVALDPQLIGALAHVALERVGPATPAVIRLHPEDYAVVSAQQSADWAGRQVQVLPDPSVSRGGCLVESEFGYIDASVDAQVAEIARVVLGDAAGPVAQLQRGAA